jgi:hypothetical protein
MGGSGPMFIKALSSIMRMKASVRIRVVSLVPACVRRVCALVSVLRTYAH